MKIGKQKKRAPKFHIAAEPQRKIEDVAAKLYSLDTIASEIRAYTGYDEAEVWRRLCLEITSPGYNVSMRSREYGVTPHVFSEAMIKMYAESDGFIFETLAESRNPHRAGKWINIFRFMMSVCDGKPEGRRVLVYGDSVGSDSIFLAKLGFEVRYHDYDSYCSRFARTRFQHEGVSVSVLAAGGPVEPHDFVICLEVAEHVPDPEKLVADLSAYTSKDGYCLFSEAFNLVLPSYPTHLDSNRQFVGRADEMFLNQRMRVVWRDRDDKPIVYAHRRDFSSVLETMLRRGTAR